MVSARLPQVAQNYHLYHDKLDFTSKRLFDEVTRAALAKEGIVKDQQYLIVPLSIHILLVLLFVCHKSHIFCYLIRKWQDLDNKRARDAAWYYKHAMKHVELVSRSHRRRLEITAKLAQAIFHGKFSWGPRDSSYSRSQSESSEDESGDTSTTGMPELAFPSST